jgi:hypothetical protein
MKPTKPPTQKPTKQPTSPPTKVFQRQSQHLSLPSGHPASSLIVDQGTDSLILIQGAVKILYKAMFRGD